MPAVSSSPTSFNAVPFTVLPSEMHTVQRGETLSGIAREHGTTVAELLRANPQIKNPDRLAIGDVLHLPSGTRPPAPAPAPSQPTTPVVQPGATLGQLARDFDTDVATLSRLNRLDPPAAKVNSDQWMDIARREIGQKEIAGAEHNPRIIQYHATTGYKAKKDETAWCSSFANWVLKQAGIQGTGSAAARSWINWGDPVGGVADARKGDIVVVRNKETGDYHVGFFDSAKPGYISLLGGNQSNQVKVSTYDVNKMEVIAIRRPPGTDASAAPKPAPTPTPAPAPTPAVSTPTGLTPQRGITEADYEALAKDLGVDVAALKAVAQVESRGDGFLESGKPKILFEAHVFSRYTDHAYDQDHPGLSAPKWDKTLYGKRGEHQWDRLQEAMKLDPEAALKAASWGRFQIMGYNHKAAGYPDVQSFVRAMSTSEAAQLQAFGSFLKSHPAMLEALRDHDWTEFARRYNGAGFAKNHYDEHMQQAYEKLTS